MTAYFANSTARKHRLPILFVLMFAPLVFLYPQAGTATTHAPLTKEAIIKQVQIFHQTLRAAMEKADELGVTGRFQLIKPVFEKTFNSNLMARIVVGIKWRKFSPDQRQRFTKIFKTGNIATYARRFDGYSGQSFKTLGTRPGPRKTMLIDTVLINPDDDDVKLTYVAKRIGKEWWIIDVLLASGISELAVKRSEYSRIVKTKGLDALSEILSSKSRLDKTE